MLIDPASNVSVPFTVVTRTRSRVPERVTEPPQFHVAAWSERPPVPAFTHTLDPVVLIIAEPCKTLLALVAPVTRNPADEFALCVAEALGKFDADDKYPETLKLPAPI